MKDYTKLIEQLQTTDEITTKELLALGYSQYDINKMVTLNIITKIARGVYKNSAKTKEVAESPTPELQPVRREKTDNYNSEGTYYLSKRQYAQAYEMFSKKLKEESTNAYAALGIFAVLVNQDKYEEAKDELIKLFRTRIDDSNLFNIYHFLLLLAKIIEIDEEIIKEVKTTLDNSTTAPKPKSGRFYYKLCKAIRNESWEQCARNMNQIIKMDRAEKRFRLINQTFKTLVYKAIDALGVELEYYANKEKCLPKDSPDSLSVNDVVEESLSGKIEEPDIIIIPEISADEMINSSLLLEAIDNNDYERALQLLASNNIENPQEVIRILINKLALIQSLVTTSSRIKVIKTEEVHLVKEEALKEEPKLFELTTEEIITSPTEEFEIPANPVGQQEPTLIDIPEISSSHAIEVNSPEAIAELTIDERINALHSDYKTALDIEDFSLAKTALRKYEYLCNTNSRYRNIAYHYKRIESREACYQENPPLYQTKKDLLNKIFQARKNKDNEEALRLIEEYKSLGGYIYPQVVIIEAEIHLENKNISAAERLLCSIAECEEPSYFMALGRLRMYQKLFQEALEYFVAYNERRPNTNAAVYVYMAECYRNIGKPSKAVKVLRKADEINKSNNKNIDLSDKIANAEKQANYQTERRLSFSNPHLQDY